MKYITKMRQGRGRGRERGGEGGGGGGKEGGVHRVLDHTYPELSVARATLFYFGVNGSVILHMEPFTRK